MKNQEKEFHLIGKFCICRRKGTSLEDHILPKKQENTEYSDLKKKYEKLEEKIYQNLGFDKSVYKWFDKIFFSQKELWRMTNKDELFYTGGLHTAYRGQIVHKHFFKELKPSSGLYEIIKLLIKFQHYDFSPKVREKEI